MRLYTSCALCLVPQAGYKCSENCPFRILRTSDIGQRSENFVLLSVLRCTNVQKTGCRRGRETNFASLPIIKIFPNKFSSRAGRRSGKQSFKESSEGMIDDCLGGSWELHGPLGGVPIVGEDVPITSSMSFFEDELCIRVGRQSGHVDRTRPT